MLRLGCRNVSLLREQPATRFISSIFAMRYSTTHGGEDSGRMGPAVRFLLGKHNLDVSKLTATGPKGTLLKGDVLKYLEHNGDGSAPIVQKLDLGGGKKSVKKKPSAPQPQKKTIPSAGEFTQKEPNKAVAKSVPHFYASTLCKTSGLRSVTNDLKAYNSSVDLGDVATRAFIVALRSCKLIEENHSINVVSLREGKLEAKTLTSATNKTFFDITALVNNPDAGLQNENVVASIFRFENLGVDSVTEMLEPEHTFSLALGGFKNDLVLVDDMPVSNEVMEVTLSCDASKITNTEMGQVMQVLHEYLEHPHDMLTI